MQRAELQPSSLTNAPRPVESPEFLRLLDAAAGPALVVDAVASRIVVANRSAAKLWGLDSLDGLSLDRATPALATLAAVASGSERVPAGEVRLCFWTQLGVRRWQCRLNPLPPRGSGLVLVHARPADAADDRTGVQPRLDLLAHELRTPLAAIAALAEIIRDQRLGAVGQSRYLGYASDIHDSAQHGLEVVAAMLSGADEAVAPAASARGGIDVGAVARGCVSAMRPLADRARVQLGTRLDAAVPRLVIDPRALRQILFNLLANALKATPPGGQITVATSIGHDGSVRLGVEDDGPGMSQAAVARVSAPGGEAADLTADAGSGHARRGSGHGLPLVRELAAANGGSVVIDSRERQGTRITLVFPPR